MDIKYAVECWTDIESELSEIFPEHWKEIALDKNAIQLEPDYLRYRMLDQADILKIVTVRDSERLVGYYVSIVTNNLHYASCKTAYCDIYFLLPQYRQGFVGINLFKFMEQEMKKIGVKKIFTMTKVHKDNSALMKRLGYSWVEKIYSKLIG